MVLAVKDCTAFGSARATQQSLLSREDYTEMWSNEGLRATEWSCNSTVRTKAKRRWPAVLASYPILSYPHTLSGAITCHHGSSLKNISAPAIVIDMTIIRCSGRRAGRVKSIRQSGCRCCQGCSAAVGRSVRHFAEHEWLWAVSCVSGERVHSKKTSQSQPRDAKTEPQGCDRKASNEENRCWRAVCC